jgi:hypothetical protein
MTPAIKNANELVDWLSKVSKDENKVRRTKTYTTGCYVTSKVRREFLTSDQQGKLILSGSVVSVSFESLGGSVYRAYLDDTALRLLGLAATEVPLVLPTSDKQVLMETQPLYQNDLPSAEPKSEDLKYTVGQNACNCFSACNCDQWAIYDSKGSVYKTFFNKATAENICNDLNFSNKK